MLLVNYINLFKASHDLPAEDSEFLFDAIVQEENDADLRELLSAWESKGPSEGELLYIAQVMRSRMKRLQTTDLAVTDIVGTGGSAQKTFNVSTAAAFVAAGAGVPIAKHGNRAASSSTGSSDVLGELGIKVDAPIAAVERCLEETRICFMFAPSHHRLSPSLARARRAHGRPTIFNNLGPLCNPAGAQHQIIGVWTYAWLERTANVLAKLGTTRSWVVHNEEGLDEIGLRGTTRVAEVTDGNIRSFNISTADFGIDNDNADVPMAENAAESAAIIKDVLSNNMSDTPAEKIVLMNAAAAILVAGHANDLTASYSVATESIRSGAAIDKLRLIAEITNR